MERQEYGLITCFLIGIGFALYMAWRNDRAFNMLKRLMHINNTTFKEDAKEREKFNELCYRYTLDDLVWDIFKPLRWKDWFTKEELKFLGLTKKKKS